MTDFAALWRPAVLVAPLGRGALNLPVRRSSVRELQVRRGLASVAIALEGDLLPFANARQAGSLNGGDEKKDVIRSAFRLDEAEALLRVGPLHGALGHRDYSFDFAARDMPQ